MSDVPVFTIPVVGYRQWLSIDGKLCPLFTMTLSAPWTPGVNHASCFCYTGDKCVEPPGESCRCGLHARHAVTETMLRDHITGRISGACVFYGILQVHNDGFRAEYGRIVALAESQQTPGIPEVAAAYGVPLVPLRMLELEGEQHGTRLPASVIPAKDVPVSSSAGPSDLGVVG